MHAHPPKDSDSTVLRPDPAASGSDVPKPGRVPVLIVLDGPDKDRRHAIRKPENLVGRDAGADFPLDDSKVSRLHLRIHFANPGATDQIPDCRLFDLGSTNGVFLNGVAVGEEGAWLRDRDRILIGDSLIGYFLLDEEAVPLG